MATWDGEGCWPCSEGYMSDDSSIKKDNQWVSKEPLANSQPSSWLSWEPELNVTAEDQVTAAPRLDESKHTGRYREDIEKQGRETR